MGTSNKLRDTEEKKSYSGHHLVSVGGNFTWGGKKKIYGFIKLEEKGFDGITKCLHHILTVSLLLPQCFALAVKNATITDSL